MIRHTACTKQGLITASVIYTLVNNRLLEDLRVYSNHIIDTKVIIIHVTVVAAQLIRIAKLTLFCYY